MTGRYLQLTPHQVNALRADPTAAEELACGALESPNQPQLDIDKAWHLIHFLLSGTVWAGSDPLSQAVLGGTELEGTDTGYGPFRLLTSAEVSAISQALAALPGEELWKRFDPNKAEAAEIYPQGWSGAEHEKTYLLEHYSALQRFFQQASSQEMGLLAYLA